MQTAAATALASAFSLLTPHVPTSASERIPPYWDDEREEWVGTPTEEEKFVALKALIDEAREEYDAGDYFEFSSFEEFRELIRVTDEEAMARFRPKRAAQHADVL